MRACVAPVCDFKSEVEELPMIDFLGLVGEMLKKILLENIRKILGSKIVQVKGLMPSFGGISRNPPPPAEPLGEVWYGITFTTVQKFIMLWDNFIRISM